MFDKFGPASYETESIYLWSLRISMIGSLKPVCMCVHAQAFGKNIVEDAVDKSYVFKNLILLQNIIN
jgi:hypothetical protein